MTDHTTPEPGDAVELVSITATAANELAWKCDVTLDDHGQPGEAPCTECDDVDAAGRCEQGRAAYLLASQMPLSMAPGARLTMYVDRTAAEYAAGELEDASAVALNDAALGLPGHMKSLAESRAYRIAAAAFRSAASKLAREVAP